MVYVRLDQDWTDDEGTHHPAGSMVDVDAGTLAQLQAQGVVSEQASPEDGSVGPSDGGSPEGGWVGPSDGGSPEGGWVGPSDGGSPEGGWVGPSGTTTGTGSSSSGSGD
jgi:hypothetical protein